MTWLAAGIPLTLILDLIEPTGPDSTRAYRDEPGDTAWVPATSASAA
jgi:hypothetical protein